MTKYQQINDPKLISAILTQAAGQLQQQTQQQEPEGSPEIVPHEEFQEPQPYRSFQPRRRPGLCLPAYYRPRANSSILRRRIRAKQWTNLDTSNSTQVAVSRRKRQQQISVNGQTLQHSNVVVSSSSNQVVNRGDTEEMPVNAQMRMKIGLALLMLPSLMVMMYSQHHLYSDSNSVDASAFGFPGFPGSGGGSGGRHSSQDFRRHFEERFGRKNQLDELEDDEEEVGELNFKSNVSKFNSIVYYK